MKIFKKHNSIVISTLFRKEEVFFNGEIMSFINNGKNIVVKLYRNGCYVLDRHGRVVVDLCENDQFYVQNLHQKTEGFKRVLYMDLAMKGSGEIMQKVVKNNKLVDVK